MSGKILAKDNLRRQCLSLMRSMETWISDCVSCRWRCLGRLFDGVRVSEMVVDPSVRCVFKSCSRVMTVVLVQVQDDDKRLW